MVPGAGLGKCDREDRAMSVRQLCLALSATVLANPASAFEAYNRGR